MSKSQIGRKTKRYPSDSAQGKGSWVELERPTVDQLETIMSLQETVEDDLAAYRAMKILLGGLLVNWNWRDVHDKPLPKPTAERFGSIVTDEEMFFLAQLLGEYAEEVQEDAKKKPTRSRNSSSSKAAVKRRE